MSEGTSIRPAEIYWHMVFVKHPGGTLPLVVGPLRSSGTASWGEGAEILWIKFKLGVFMPHLPTKNYLDGEQVIARCIERALLVEGRRPAISRF